MTARLQDGSERHHPGVRGLAAFGLGDDEGLTRLSGRGEQGPHETGQEGGGKTRSAHDKLLDGSLKVGLVEPERKQKP